MITNTLTNDTSNIYTETNCNNTTANINKEGKLNNTSCNTNMESNIINNACNTNLKNSTDNAPIESSIKNKVELNDLILKAKDGNEIAMVTIINKFKFFAFKYCSSYSLRNYEFNDLLQIGTIAIIKAVKKFDIAKNSSFDSYVINSIKNAYREIARKNIKYNSESSLNVALDGQAEIIDLLPDSFELENSIINIDTIKIIKSTISKFTPFEQVLLKSTYFTTNSSLHKFCIANNITYYKGKTLLNTLLSKLRNELS